MSEFRILLVDDEADQLETLTDILEARGYTVTGRQTAEKALEVLATDTRYHLVIADLLLPGMDGLAMVSHIQALRNRTAVIMITGHGSVDSAVKAMKLGALDYLEKPVNPEALVYQVQKAKERQILLEENAYLIKELAGSHHPDNIIGKSPAILEVLEKIRSLSTSEASVLITGESGTGKEMIANSLHYSSSRQKRPLLKVSCAALSEGTLESELFGHERGAFTGAISRHIGIFETIEGGTLFLDEIGDIHLTTQAKLLRVLETGEFVRVGGNQVLHSDFRLIAATNHDLKAKVREEKFRLDLYYRLCVVEIEIPPLRSRREDIPPLIHHFIETFRLETNKHNVTINEEVMAALVRYNWPGNVRDLRNAVESAFVYCTGDTLELKHFPPRILGTENVPADLSRLGIRTLGEVEKAMLDICMKEANGNKTKASSSLGISRSTLISKLKKHGLNQYLAEP